ncbi:hypothetical protein TRVA0_018S01948 [Trichomonascus vanleenenianus]|uniref:uncharacterized protein n=1 Tax=Trichomonascus vanleenenianus TaxID=2268995 RepID=UPI003ECB8B4B
MSAKTKQRDNIKVIARFRPENTTERETGTPKVVRFLSNSTCEIESRDFKGTFTFDRVFDENAPQAEVFDYSLKVTVDDLMNGYNGTVFAYGQTGSGKSYTMMGPDIDDDERRGAIPRIVDRIFDEIMSSPSDIEYMVRVSYMEIYMEKIRDLLDPRNDNLSIHEDKARGVYVKDLSEEYVASAREVYDVMRQGAKVRAVASTNMNQESSRSHSIFVINVSQKSISTGTQKSGQLFLVDLAGSEKVGKTGAKGRTLEEAKKINKSLSALGMVINSLTDGKSTHVPYRDSKLTRILQESLGGNSRTSLIVNCSPSQFNDVETISTLRFGVRAKTIQNKAKINAELSPLELRQMLKKCQAQLDARNAYVHKLEAELTSLRGPALGDRELQTATPTSSRLDDDSDVDDFATNTASTASTTPVLSERDNESMRLQVDKLEYEKQEVMIRNTSLSEENRRLSQEIGAMRQRLLEMAVPEPSEEKAGESEAISGTRKTLLCDKRRKVSQMLGKYYEQSPEAIIDEVLEHLQELKYQQVQHQTPAEEIQCDDRYDIAYELLEGLKPRFAKLNAQLERSEKEKQDLKESEEEVPSTKRWSTGTDVFKHSLMRQLQERCERIVELEMSLEQAKEQYNMAIKNKSQQRRMALLQRNLETLTTVQQKLVKQNSDLKNDIVMSNKLLQARNERIEHLEQSLIRSQQALLEESEEFESKLTYLRNKVVLLSQKNQTIVHDDDMPHPKIVKPLRGGGGRATNSEKRFSGIFNKINSYIA